MSVGELDRQRKEQSQRTYHRIERVPKEDPTRSDVRAGRTDQVATSSAEDGAQ